MKKKKIGRRSGIVVLGYVEMDGMRTFTDEFIRSLWDRIKEDSLDHIWDSEVVKDRKDFLDWAKRPEILISMIIIDKEVAGIGWLHDMGRNYASASFMYFKNFWGTGTLEMGEALTDNWFSFKNDAGEDLIDVLIGKTPAHNGRACKYLNRLGWTILGTIPLLDRGGDMMISYKTRGYGNG